MRFGHRPELLLDVRHRRPHEVQRGRGQLRGLNLPPQVQLHLGLGIEGEHRGGGDINPTVTEAAAAAAAAAEVATAASTAAAEIGSEGEMGVHRQR